MSNVFLLRHTLHPVETIALETLASYSSVNVSEFEELYISKEEANKIVKDILSQKNEKPFEHIYFTFGITGVSHLLYEQIKCSKMGAYNVESIRHANEHNSEYVIPPSIIGNKAALAEFERCMKQCVESYAHIVSILDNGCKGSHRTAMEDSKFVIPNAFSVKIIITMNLKELRDFFRKNLCMNTYWEIRNIAYKMFEISYYNTPILFEDAVPSCVIGKCNADIMCCGKYGDARRQIESIKDNIIKKQSDIIEI